MSDNTSNGEDFEMIAAVEVVEEVEELGADLSQATKPAPPPQAPIASSVPPAAAVPPAVAAPAPPAATVDLSLLRAPILNQKETFIATELVTRGGVSFEMMRKVVSYLETQAQRPLLHQYLYQSSASG
ncbi:MAG: hypothetical protein P1V97_35430, partial [Planctomycetota bacterium]|nr:hypothetical protein [Planctomycetota bacterium]